MLVVPYSFAVSVKSAFCLGQSVVYFLVDLCVWCDGTSQINELINCFRFSSTDGGVGRVVLFKRCRLVKDLSLLQADRKGGQPLQSRKLGAAGLFRCGQRRQHRQRRGGHGTAAQVFCLSMQSSEFKHSSVKTVANVYSDVIVKVSNDLFKHHAEKDAEQSQSQNTTLFHAVDDVQPNLSALVFLQLDNHANEFFFLGGGSLCALWSSAVPFYSQHQTLWSGPQTLHIVLCSSPYISFRSIIGRTPGLLCPCCLRIHTGFLVDGLQWWWIPIFLWAHGEGFFLRWKAEWSPDSWSNLTFRPCFVQGDDDCFTEITWKFVLLPTTDKKFVVLTVLCWSSFSSGILSTPAALPLLNCSIAFPEGSSFNSALNGYWVIRRTAGSWTTQSALKRDWKSSDQQLRMESLSVKSTCPSALGKGL